MLKRVNLLGARLVLTTLILFFLTAMPLGAGGIQQTKPPIEKEGLLLALRDRVLTKEKLIAQVTSRGVDFRLTGSDERQIRAAGGYLGQNGLNELIAAIRSSYRILILFAEFQSLDKQDHGVTEMVIDQLRAAMSKYSDTRVQYLADIITAQQGDEIAREKGKKLGADFVIWGWYGVNPISVHANVHFVFVKGLKSWSLCKKAEEENITTPLAEIQTYSLQTQLTDHMTYLTLFATGLARLEANDLDGAIERFNRVLEVQNTADQIIDPADIYRYRAYAFLLKDKYDLAIADWDKAIALKPDAWSFVTRGLTHHDKGDYGLAIADYGRALALNPGYTDVFYDRGLYHLEEAKYDLAIADFTTAIQLDPANSDLYYARGAAYTEKREDEFALADYTDVIRLSPRFACAYNNRGVVYKRIGKYDLAVADFGKAIQLDPTERSFRNRASAYYTEGQYNLAIADYDKVIALNARDADTYYSRALAHSQVGDIRRAASDLRKAILLTNDPHLRRKADLELKRITKP